MTVTVIGIGNRFRRDDGAGPEVARLVAERGASRVRAVERVGEPLDLLEAWEGAEDVVVVDAVRSGAAPGTVRRLDPSREPLPDNLLKPSTHLLGLHEAIELARALDRLPPRLRVVGIEGASFEAGEGLSEPVRQAVERLAEELG